MRSRLKTEIWIILTITFGMSGLRSLLRLINDLLSPTPLNQQTTTLNSSQSQVVWLDLAFQLCGAAVLLAWAALALYLLNERPERPRGRNVAWGAGLAAVIGIPGLGFYVGAVHLGLSKVVVPEAITHPAITVPVLLLWSLANAVGEEVVVVKWLSTRLSQLGWAGPAILTASAVLRGSYHLYQGVSAGVGNIVMGLVYGLFFAKTGRVWPLIVGHFLIDAVAFIGYSALGGHVSWLGL